MKHLSPVPLIATLALLLSGCPDTGVPKVPPNIPAPKAADSALQRPADDARPRAGVARLRA
ncbi:MAG: hypothetical protein MUP33_01570 [Polaromonas sp.]|nr:hypothetical protein [Polaromonas sp.]